MTKKEFENFCELFLKEAAEIREKKGEDYSSKDSDDRLLNFKDIAKRLGIESRQVWGNFFLKGIDAIEKFIRTGKLESEPLDQRFLDAINYLLLGAALFHEAGLCNMVHPAKVKDLCRSQKDNTIPPVDQN